MCPSPILVWFRDDLRLADNPALATAAATGRPIVALYVLDEVSPGGRRLGAAARWWLHHGLAALDAALASIGGTLTLRRGPAAMVVPRVVAEIGATAVHWNRRSVAGEIAIDRDLKTLFRERGIEARSFQANLLFEPRVVRTRGGGPFRVFTPFWKACLAAAAPRAPLPAPLRIPRPFGSVESDSLDGFGLLPTAPDWAGCLAAAWTPGETSARKRLDDFLRRGLRSYELDRDRPDLDGVSRLSPHLRFGEISPFTIWAEVEGAMATGAVSARTGAKFLSEIGWREFSHHLLFHFPDLATRNFQARFDALAWREDPAFLSAWRRGRTGYPIVDAGLRQLRTTGWMHNRVRMIAASLLTKNGLIDWREGERWFWDTLVDACPANNPAGWQWVAGTGADAAPFFRIFNPVVQGAKFDPDGSYVRRWVPELARLPTAVIHAPWEADPTTTRAAGVRLGETYPHPIVDHGRARARALAAYAEAATPE